MRGIERIQSLGNINIREGNSALLLPRAVQTAHPIDRQRNMRIVAQTDSPLNLSNSAVSTSPPHLDAIAALD